MKNEEAIPEYFLIAQRKNKILIPLQSIRDWCRVKYIKWTHWEYWPMWLVYLPASFYFVYLSIKVKTFCFFSAANPGIENGGMIFESKWNIFNIIPKQYYPKTVIVKEGEDIHSAISKIQEAGMEFPIIAKPDRGERGWCVEIIQSLAALESYLLKCPIDFLLQQYIDYPIELSIFYYRHPATAKGTITSITKKEYLKVTGDGVSDLFSLITADDRAFLQLKKLQLTSTINFNKILNKGEINILVPFGNHVRGAMFLDYSSIGDEKLTDVIDNMSKQIDGFYYGRFDIKCKSIEDLKANKNFAVLELNGSGAEPAHIYQPGFSFFKAQKIIMAHYKMMYQAAKFNHQNGVAYLTLKSFRDTIKKQKEYKMKVLNV